MMKNTQPIHKHTSMPDKLTLNTLDNPHSDRDYTISLNISELTCLCPIDNQPSFGKLSVEYIPDKHCLEMKSFKSYVHALRNTTFFQEEIVNQIRDQLIGVLAPRYLHLVAEFDATNGVAMTVSANYHKKDWLPNQLRLPQPAKLLDKPA